MKKFMFSAVALIAFSFAGMANAGGEEKLNNEKITLIKQSPCGEYAANAVQIEQESGFMDAYEQYDAYMFYFDLCNDLGANVVLLPVVVTP